MGVKPALGLRVGTRLALTPHMMQSLSVLRLPAAELHELAAREAAENPFLRLRPAVSGGGNAAALEMAAAPVGFVAGLVHQIRQQALAPDVRDMAEYLAGALREDGYLDAGTAELAAELALPESLVEAGLSALQACEPAGIGARNLAECLLLQLLDRGLDREIAGAVVANLADLAAGRFALAGRRIGVSAERARELAALLRGLDPHPVKPEVGAEPLYLRPDLTLRRDRDGGLTVTLSRELPTLSVDADLSRSLRAAAALRRAEALVAAIAQRNRTLLAIGEAILRRQEAFFLAGPAALKPLTRAELAADLGLHPATLGRAVAGKGLEVGGRILPLSLFFSAALPARADRAGAETVSALAVSQRIARMIAAEPAEAPLSDEGIALRLAEDGIDIARRTVAKYREGMRIPSSRRRRRAGVRRGAEG